MSRVGEVLHGGEITAGDVAQLQEKLLFDRYPKRDRFVRFFVMLMLATIIATYGVVSDSVATVIGAMIVSPLMTPIMAVSLSIVTGDRHNIVRSLLIVAVGIVGVIGFAFLLASAVGSLVHIDGNAEITSRTYARLIDLIIALASGAAGAFAIGRKDVSDVLPGVAIAISLVPPLSVVGICLSAGAYGEALGAFLLFFTNFLAIVIAGLLILAVMGYGAAALNLGGKKAKRWAVIATIIATLVIAVPLTITGKRVASQYLLLQRTQEEVEAWLGGTGYEVYELDADGHDVDAIVSGEGELPQLDDLLSALRERVGDMTIKINVIPKRVLEGSTVE